MDYIAIDCLLIISLLLVFRIHQLNQMNIQLQARLQQAIQLPSTPKIKQKQQKQQPRQSGQEVIETEIPVRKQVKIEQLEKIETKEKDDSDSLLAHEEELQSTPPQKYKKEETQNLAPLKSNQFSCEPTRRRLFKEED